MPGSATYSRCFSLAEANCIMAAIAASRQGIRILGSAKVMCQMIPLFDSVAITITAQNVWSDLRVELEEGVQRLQELATNLFLARSLDQVHRDACRGAV